MAGIDNNAVAVVLLRIMISRVVVRPYVRLHAQPAAVKKQVVSVLLITPVSIV